MRQQRMAEFQQMGKDWIAGLWAGVEEGWAELVADFASLDANIANFRQVGIDWINDLWSGVR